MDASLVPTSLYLHGGPGLSAVVERAWFGDSLPIDWWDQPLVGPEDGAPLQALVDAARARLLHVAQRCGTRVTLVSHSVGSVIAAHLLADSRNPIESATLINPIFDLEFSLRRLAQRVMAAGMASGAAAEALGSLLGRDDDVRPHLLDLAAALGSIPERFDLYWSASSRAAKARYLGLAPNGPLLDGASFSMLGAAIQQGRNEIFGIGTDVPVLAIVGSRDPLVGSDPAADVRACLPRAEVITVDAGHMAVFEQPGSVWLPSSVDA